MRFQGGLVGSTGGRVGGGSVGEGGLDGSIGGGGEAVELGGDAVLDVEFEVGSAGFVGLGVGEVLGGV